MRGIIEWGDVPGRHTPKDWRRVLERQGHLCAFCGKGERRLFKVRRIPSPRGGTNFVGNLVGLCWTCKNYKHGLTWTEMLARARRAERIRARAEAGEFGPIGGGNALPMRRHRRFLDLAKARGFLREDGTAVQLTDPDACTCRRRGPHIRGSEECRG